MAVKVLIKRRFKEKHFKDIDEMIKKHRYDAINQEGYISSETLWDSKDPFRVVVASNWRTMKQWNIWKNTPERRVHDEKISKFLDGETEYEIYDMGIYPH